MWISGFGLCLRATATRVQYTVLALFLASVAFGEVVAEPYWFRPDGCDFRVKFPSPPQITTILMPGFDGMPEAELGDDNRGLMRASCVVSSEHGRGNPIPAYLDRRLLVRLLQTWVEDNGVQYVYYTNEKTRLGVRASARGTKRIDGRALTVEAIWYASPRSIMSLTVVQRAESYPSAGISDFLSSVSQSRH